jgi:hypothetical protein
MKLQFIAGNINAVVEALCVEHPDIQDILRNHTICAGGAITSMLMGTKVNDYDFYFDSFEAVRSVLSYFTKKENGVVGWYSAPFTNIKGESESRVFLQAADGMVATAEKSKYSARFFSDNAISLNGKVQLILRFYGTPEQIFKNYDFIHCTCYWSSSTGIVAPKKALESILTKELYYQGSLYPICSILRIRKFIKRGWKISAGQVLKMILQVSEVDLTHRATLRDQLVGVDMLYLKGFLDAALNSEDESVDLNFITGLLDEAFGEEDFEDISIQS